MDIFILREGAQEGPFSEETIRRLLSQQSLASADLAWRPGAEHWIPLHDLLESSQKTEPSAPAPPPPPPLAPELSAPPAEAKESAPAEAGAEAAPARESATAKQRAFLGYMGVALPADLSKEQAALLVSETMENPKDPARLARWNDDRFRLHPDLFAAELQAKKDNRANRFFELAQTIGSKCFDGLAKAHCQVLVGYLDVKFPNWDAHESDAAWHYFFPAVAEKFPDLVTREWRGKLKYPSGPKVASELKNRHQPALVTKRNSKSPIWAMLQGVVIGAIALVVLVGGIRIMRSLPQSPAKKADTAPTPPVAAAQPPVPPDPSVSAPPTPQPVAEVQSDPQPAPAPPMAESAPAASATQAPAATAPAAPVPSPLPSALPPSAANGDATAIPPPPDIMAGKPAASDAAPDKPAAPASSLDSLFAAPGSTAAATPAPAAPAATPAAAPAASPKKNSVTLTKAIEVPVPFGRTQLPAGTQLKLIARDGTMVKVGYLDMVVSIPLSATDLVSDTQ